MPLHFGKIASLIAILTIGAFVLWLLFGSIVTGERADEAAEPMSEAPSMPAEPGQ